MLCKCTLAVSKTEGLTVEISSGENFLPPDSPGVVFYELTCPFGNHVIHSILLGM